MYTDTWHCVYTRKSLCFLSILFRHVAVPEPINIQYNTLSTTKFYSMKLHADVPYPNVHMVAHMQILSTKAQYSDNTIP